jgi:hypothetical protein
MASLSIKTTFTKATSHKHKMALYCPMDQASTSIKMENTKECSKTVNYKVKENITNSIEIIKTTKIHSILHLAICLISASLTVELNSNPPTQFTKANGKIINF